MRLAAQMRGGFYPAPPAAVTEAVIRLIPPREPWAMLDPCAGAGAALSQLAQELGCPASTTYAIELDDSRAEQLHTALPNAHVLAPASFSGCRASRNSFSFIWLNPPFDAGYEGQRMEQRFLINATDWLMAGGVLALVCPASVADEFTDVGRHLRSYYEHCTIVPFPAQHRRFEEVIVLAHKRLRPQGEYPTSWVDLQAQPGFRYRIPAGTAPRVFQKVEPTELELQRLLTSSPLRRLLLTVPRTDLAAPPLALGIGHVALLLASGHLDGIVQPDGQPAHVVRGTARKQEFVAEETSSINADGTTTQRTILSERIELLIRTVDHTGTIRTFGGSAAS